MYMGAGNRVKHAKTWGARTPIGVSGNFHISIRHEKIPKYPKNGFEDDKMSTFTKSLRFIVKAEIL